MKSLLVHLELKVPVCVTVFSHCLHPTIILLCSTEINQSESRVLCTSLEGRVMERAILHQYIATVHRLVDEAGNV